MAKSSYLANSAKLLCIVSALLFGANALVTIGSFEGYERWAQWGTRLSSLALYVVLVIGYVAFNGEGVGHKRYRDRKSKRVTGFLKFNLFFCFVLNFLKSGLNYAILTLDGVAADIAGFLMSAVSVFGSYVFLLWAVSLWYILRDRSCKNLLPLEIIAFICGILYNVYKLFNYAVVKYRINAFGELFAEIFSDSNTLKILCLLQLFFDILMFLQICFYYGKLGDEEQKVLDSNVRELVKARNVYKEEGYGIDTLEDDFLN